MDQRHDRQPREHSHRAQQPALLPAAHELLAEIMELCARHAQQMVLQLPDRGADRDHEETPRSRDSRHQGAGEQHLDDPRQQSHIHERDKTDDTSPYRSRRATRADGRDARGRGATTCCNYLCKPFFFCLVS